MENIILEARGKPGSYLGYPSKPRLRLVAPFFSLGELNQPGQPITIEDMREPEHSWGLSALGYLS